MQWEPLKGVTQGVMFMVRFSLACNRRLLYHHKDYVYQNYMQAKYNCYNPWSDLSVPLGRSNATMHFWKLTLCIIAVPNE